MDVPQTLGKYEIRGTLGRGAMGVVYDGWDPRIARPVAIKTVPLPANPDPETENEIARFRREAQAAGRLAHPNIVAVYDYGETSDAAYIVMEHVDGPALKTLLDRGERFSLDSIGRVMSEVLAGLQFSHERGVVHRDIKPGNIMLTREGQAKIADFGIARIEMSSMTQAGTMMGTPAYMSPEQFRGETTDARTDVYSAGVVLYQLLTGERPFEGGLTTMMHKVLNTDPPVPSQLAGSVSKAVDAVVLKAMAKRPQDRFATAAAFAEGLRAAIAAPADTVDEEATLVRPARPAAAAAAAPARAAPDIPPAAPASESRRPRLPFFGGVAVLLLVLIAGGVWYFARSPAPLTQTASTGTVQPPAQTSAESPPGAAPAIQPPVKTSDATSPPVAATATPTIPPVPAEPPPAPPTQGQSETSGTPIPAAAPSVPKPTDAPATQAAEPPPGPAQPQSAPPAAGNAAPPEIPQAAPPNAATAAPAAPPKPSAEAENQPPKPPPTTSPPAEPKPPALAGAAVTQQIAQALHAARCALADVVTQDNGALSVNGVADAATEQALRRQFEGQQGMPAVDWRVRIVDPVFCPALALLHPISPLAGAPGHGVGVALQGNRTMLQDGDPILPRITMPDFAGELRVDYLASDGSVAHLFPTVAQPAVGVAAQPSRRLAAGERLPLGDPGRGKPLWKTGEPYGTDMIMAIASSAPLHVVARENSDDHADAYLAELGRAVQQAIASGVRVRAGLLLVDATRKAK